MKAIRTKSQKKAKSPLYDWLNKTKGRPNSALKYKNLETESWDEYSWDDYLKLVTKAAQFINSHVGGKTKTQKRIALLAQTRWEWAVLDTATLSQGHTLTPLYPNQTDEDFIHILKTAQPSLLIVEDENYLKQFNRIKSRLKFNISVASLQEIDFDISSVTQAQINQVINRSKDINLSDAATIIFTSGTTGKPKGVVLTHEALASEIEDVFDLFELDTRHTSLTFLPYAHVLGRIEHLGSLYGGYTLAFAESIDSIRKNLTEIKPDFLVAVPRIFEKIYSAVLSKVETQAIKKKLFEYTLNLAEQKEHFHKTEQAIPLGQLLQFSVLNQAVFSPIRQIFGGNLKYAICGGAPFSEQLSVFYKNLGIQIYIGYGLTETFAAIAVNSPQHSKLGTVGKPIGDVKFRIAEDGEILIKSKKCLTEYLDDPKSTEEAFTEDGYFKTGDIGEITSDGFLRITDRKKDLIKTSGGKYVAPQKIENLLKQNPLISQVLVLGDQQKFISAIINIDPEKITSEQEMNVKNHIRKINSKLASFESIKRFEIISESWTTQNGMLTPSLKVKRKVLEEKYKALIKKLYQG